MQEHQNVNEAQENDSYCQKNKGVCYWMGKCYITSLWSTLPFVKTKHLRDDCVCPQGVWGSPFCRPIHSCLWSFFCMSLMTWLLCLRASASLMQDMKWASTTELDGQWSRSRSGKFWYRHKHFLNVQLHYTVFATEGAEEYYQLPIFIRIKVIRTANSPTSWNSII